MSASGDGSSLRGGLLDSVFESAADLAESARVFLSSDEGRKLRNGVATVVILGAPILSQLPVLRRSPVARLLRTAAVGTLLVKGAEWLREWEPRPRYQDLGTH